MSPNRSAAQRRWILGTSAALFVAVLAVVVGFFRYYYPDLALRDALNNDESSDVLYWAEHGGNARVRGFEGVTALHYAAAHAKPALVRRLLNQGAEPDAKTDGGETPLWWLSYGGGGPDRPERTAILHLLLDRGADVKARNSSGYDAVMGAAGMGRFVIVRELLARGAEVNGSDLDGWTALMNAAFNGHDHIVRLLIAHHANLSARTRTGDTAVLIARSHPQVVATLRKAGAGRSK